LVSNLATGFLAVLGKLLLHPRMGVERSFRDRGQVVLTEACGAGKATVGFLSD
jgi:hypothetical protein